MATIIQSHVTQCPSCNTVYTGLSPLGKDASHAIYNLHVLNSAKNTSMCDERKLSQKIAVKLEQRRELSQLKSEALSLEDRVRCHKLAHCTLQARSVQILSESQR
jgi:hypothetical protein